MSTPLPASLAVAAAFLLSSFGTNFSMGWLVHLSLARLVLLSSLVYVLLRLTWKLFLYPYYFTPLLKLPQAPPRGEGESFFIPRTPDKVLQWINTIPNHGVIRYLDFLNQDTVTVTSAKAIAEFLQTKSDHYSKRPKQKRVMEGFLGYGLVTSEGAEHKYQRKNLAPAFNSRVIKNLYPLFWSKASEMVTLMTEDMSGPEKTFNIDDWAGRAALDIIGKAGFGSDFNALSNPDTDLNTAYRTSFTPNKRSGKMFLISLLTHPRFANLLPIEAKYRVQAGLDAVNAFLGNFIDQKIKETMNRDAKNLQKSAHKDIISAAIQTGAFTAGNLVDQSKTLLGAGHETSATALNWAIYLLSRRENTSFQRILRDEIRANLPSPSTGIEVAADVLDKLPYLEAVCKEILRIRAPVPQLGRIAAQDTTLCGLHIPKGTTVMVHAWAINRSRILWGEDADIFNPQRWLAEDSSNNGGANPLAFMTFGTGTRGCIGKGFAEAEIKALLAALVGRFEFEPTEVEEEIKIFWAITARIVGGFEVKVKVVEGW